jgi:hypothetical protein
VRRLPRFRLVFPFFEILQTNTIAIGFEPVKLPQQCFSMRCRRFAVLFVFKFQKIARKSCFLTNQF